MNARETHFVPYDAPGGRIAQALCGQHVNRQYDHSNQPSCSTCATEQARYENLDLGRHDPPPAKPPVVKVDLTRRVKQDEYATLGLVKDGKLQLSGRAAFEQAMRRFPDGPVVVSIKTEKPQRSSQQNRFWHGVVIPLFAEHCGYDFDDMKDVLALELLPKEIVDVKTGEVRIVPGHTSGLTTKQFNDLIERAQRLGAELGIYVPDPNEVAA